MHPPEVARAAVYAAGAHLDDVDLASYADLDRGISGANDANMSACEQSSRHVTKPPREKPRCAIGGRSGNRAI